MSPQRNNRSWQHRSRTIPASLTILLTVANCQMLFAEASDGPAWLHSGLIENPGDEFLSIDVGVVRVPGADWIRVHFGEYELGQAGFVTLESTENGETQIFNARTLADWYNWSAMFRGDAVQITLHVAPHHKDIYLTVDLTRTPVATAGGEPNPELTICGANDDRVASADSRVGRMATISGGAYCTGWLISNGAVLSAGHCAPVAPGDLLEFNVPASTANGRTVSSAVVDQYPINLATVSNEDDGVGKDWFVFGLHPNSTTGLRAHMVQGFFRMTKVNPVFGTNLRVTGYGLDNSPSGTGGANAACCDPDGSGPMGCGFNCNSASQTLQTATGLLASTTNDLIEHSVDTMSANSGSPIIWEATGYTIGIHTAGGCTSSSGFNNGTRFSRVVLETAIREFIGANPLCVDSFNGGLPANGGVFEPLHSVSAAVSAVANGGTISLVTGSYPVSAGNTFTAGADGRAMTMVAPVGLVIIGN